MRALKFRHGLGAPGVPTHQTRPHTSVCPPSMPPVPSKPCSTVGNLKVNETSKRVSWTHISSENAVERLYFSSQSLTQSTAAIERPRLSPAIAPGEPGMVLGPSIEASQLCGRAALAFRAGH